MLSKVSRSYHGSMRQNLDGGLISQQFLIFSDFVSFEIKNNRSPNNIQNNRSPNNVQIIEPLSGAVESNIESAGNDRRTLRLSFFYWQNTYSSQNEVYDFFRQKIKRQGFKRDYLYTQRSEHPSITPISFE